MRKHRVLALLASSAMALSLLSGCGNADSAAEAPADEVTSAAEDTTDAGTAATEEAAGADTDAADEGDAAAQAIADRKAEAEKNGEYEKIVVSFFDWTGAPAGIDRVNAALSAHTEETLGVDVELQIIDSAAYADNMKLMLSSGEQVDLFSTCSIGYPTAIMNGYALSMDEDDLFDTYGKGIQEKIRKDYIDACRVSGVLYGTPPIKDYAIQTCAVCIGQEYLDGIGYDASALETDENGYPIATWDEINDIFAKLHEKYPDKYVYSMQDNMLTQGSSVDNIGGDYYGVLLDSANSLKVEDAYSSDVFREWCERTYDWNQKGYLSKDALTDDTGASARIKSGAYMAMMACSKPGYKTQISGECGRDMAVFDVGESFMSSASVSSFPWCINQNTEDPVAAMQVLDAMYTDPVVSNLMCWGEEGKEYKVNDDETITFADGVDANNSEYYPNVLWLMPNPYVAHVWQGDPLDIGDQIATFNNNAVTKSKALGFTWDNTDYAAEFTALQNAYDQYGKQVSYGFVEPEKGIADLEAALKAAGLDEYMAAKQEALDAWAKENGIQ
ncbi:putative aldouronate transport system substrate-binding protein [Lachnospiraceae bacterium NK3A20]|nr:putative aldouronate transport system substrate-binding protein [Lachnospiraceae bacterium NK3A20]